MKYFHDKDYLRELFDRIGEVLRKNIKRYFALGTRMKLLRDIHKESDHLSKDDLIIISRDLSPENKKNIHAAAQENGAAGSPRRPAGFQGEGYPVVGADIAFLWARDFCARLLTASHRP